MERTPVMSDSDLSKNFFLWSCAPMQVPSGHITRTINNIQSSHPDKANTLFCGLDAPVKHQELVASRMDGSRSRLIT